jgi:hypothetical protein
MYDTEQDYKNLVEIFIPFLDSRCMSHVKIDTPTKDDSWIVKICVRLKQKSNLEVVSSKGNTLYPTWKVAYWAYTYMNVYHWMKYYYMNEVSFLRRNTEPEEVDL